MATVGTRGVIGGTVPEKCTFIFSGNPNALGCRLVGRTKRHSRLEDNGGSGSMAFARVNTPESCDRGGGYLDLDDYRIELLVKD
jgi:hypothetical protein